MSKINELKIKFSNIRGNVFNQFVEGDRTRTKKYLPYMLKMWNKRSIEIKSVNHLIGEVRRFDMLLPYIPLKDIYNQEYNDFEFLVEMNNRAEEVKEEKTFDRIEHCDVLDENERYLMVRPKTFRGSLKYGANTKWCTASKSSESTFKRYFNSGYLVYIIDKTNKTGKKCSKIALYSDYAENPLIGDIRLYNSLDNEVNEDILLNEGWDHADIFNIVMLFRYNLKNHKDLKVSIDFIHKFKNSIDKLNFNELSRHMINMDKNSNIEYFDEIKNVINKFKNKLETYGHG